MKSGRGGGIFNRFVDYKIHRYKLSDPKSGVIEKLCCFLQTRSGELWLGSNEYGLYRRVRDKEGKVSFRAYTMKDGLANNSVKGLVEDDHGMIWIATNNGLSRFNPESGLFSNYTVDDGLLSDQFYWNGAICSSTGDIWLGTNKGLVELRGYNTEPQAHKGRLSFTRLTVDNQEVFAGSKYLDDDITSARVVRLKEWNKSIEIDFSALNYYHEKTGTYCYRMKGFEQDWQQLPPGQHSVRYTNLPPGTYDFEVKYTPSDVNSKADTATVRFEVQAYFYKSPLFVLLVIVVLTAVAIVLYKRHIKQLRRHEADILLDPIRKTLTETGEPVMLRKQIQNILDNQNRYKESYMKTAHDNDVETAQKTEPFMDKVMRVMEQRYSNSDFGGTELSAELGITKAMLSKKLSMETGLSTTKFICNYRLNIARELLTKNAANRNIAEIAFSVGFNDPKYFTRCFTREYGVAPNKYMRT